jgi:hypothetical protein
MPKNEEVTPPRCLAEAYAPPAAIAPPATIKNPTTPENKPPEANTKLAPAAKIANSTSDCCITL